MTKLYVIISALILFALLVFSPLFSLQDGVQAVGTLLDNVSSWTAGPGSYSG